MAFGYDERGMRVIRRSELPGGAVEEEAVWLRNARNFTLHSDDLVELAARLAWARADARRSP